MVPNECLWEKSRAKGREGQERKVCVGVGGARQAVAWKHKDLLPDIPVASMALTVACAGSDPAHFGILMSRVSPVS